MLPFATLSFPDGPPFGPSAAQSTRTFNPFSEAALRTLCTVLTLGALCLCAAAQTTGQTSSPQAAARTDVYHVMFTKTALGKAAQAENALKAGLPGAPMPDHRLVLRHQEGDEWDYMVIEHMGTKATVEATGTPIPPATRDLFAWHGDTLAAGPSWAEFTRAMGIAPDAVGKTGGSVYVVQVANAAPGQRDALEKAVSTPPAPGNGGPAVPSEIVVLQHLEGGPWNFITVTRYNSWQDFGTDEAARTSAMAKTPGQGGWYQLRDVAPFHRDTLTDRVFPPVTVQAATK